MKGDVEMETTVMMNTYQPFPHVFIRGEDVYLFDEQENKYLDFVAGIAVNGLGYSHKGLKESLHNQVDMLLHCSNLYYNQMQLLAGKKLTEASQMDQVFFCNSGTEAVEAAMKLGRKYAAFKGKHQCYEIISMKNSFHGRTLGAVSATGQEKYQKGLHPLLPGIKHIPYNDIHALKNSITEKTCGVLLEVIQGEGGIRPANSDYLKTVRQLCNTHDLVLILDEVQTGVGRTGKFCGYMQYDIQPDILALAKGLGGGVPVGAMLASKKVAQGFKPGDHASTFGGNPLAMAAVKTVVTAIMEEGFLEHVQEMGVYLTHELNVLKETCSVIQDIRGIGLMQGIELSISAKEVVQEAYEKKVLLVGAGENIIRFVPPLIIERHHINHCIAVLKNILEKR